MLFMPLIRRRIKGIEIKYLLTWLLSLIVVIWLMNNINTNENCNDNLKLVEKDEPYVEFIRLQDDISNAKLLDENTVKKNEVFPYNRNMPLIFVGGVPRSGIYYKNKYKLISVQRE